MAGTWGLSQSLEKAVKGPGRDRTSQRKPSLETTPTRPLLGLLTKFAKGPSIDDKPANHNQRANPLPNCHTRPTIDRVHQLCMDLSSRIVTVCFEDGAAAAVLRGMGIGQTGSQNAG